MAQEYMGQSLPRFDGLGQVNGSTVYVDDVEVSGMTYVKVLRAPVQKG